MIIVYGYLVIALCLLVFQLYGMLKEKDYEVSRVVSLVMAVLVSLFWPIFLAYAGVIYINERYLQK